MSMPFCWRAGICAAFSFLLLAPLAQAQSGKAKETVRLAAKGRLICEDTAGIFSPEAIKKAKGYLAEVQDHYSHEMEILSLRELPEAKRKEFEKLTDTAAKEHFFTELARDEAKASQARGVFVLIVRKPHYLIVLTDRQTKDKGFTSSDEQRVRGLFLDAFRDASKAEKEEDKQALYDKGLLSAAEYVRDAYKKIAK
jgi:hypothetical protein